MDRRVLALLAAAATLAACDLPILSPGPEIPRGGETLWIQVPEGLIKTRAYVSRTVTRSPVLVIALHGDIPDPPPTYQYWFAQALTEGPSAVQAMAPEVRTALGEGVAIPGIMAAGVLRPGYADRSGARSSGNMGAAIGDNYTPAVTDAVAETVRRLRAEYHPRKVVLVGHSGGAAIVANLLGRHPGIADGALLVGCACDPVAWRARRKAEEPSPVWDQPNPSLLPLDLAPKVRRGVKVRLVVGDQDEVTPPAYSQAYAAALKDRGVDAKVTVAPGLGHNIMFSRPVFDQLRELIAEI